MSISFTATSAPTAKERTSTRRPAAGGVLFFRYDPDEKPVVTAEGKRVAVRFNDPILGRRVSRQGGHPVSGDRHCSLTRSRPCRGIFKVPVDTDGWLLEAHQKLRPVEFANDGVFLCGMAHYPKPIEESIAQAQAAAARAVAVLARDNIMVGGLVARIEPELCSGCLGCINVCPYGAITFNAEKKIAEVNQALCKGCGACAAACPSEAPVLHGI